MKTQPRKRFGQHFLHDKGVIDHIVATLAPRPEEHLIEIGPGQGALTVPVLRRTKQLEAVEFDRDLIPVLSERAKAAGDLTIYSADVLSFDFASVKKDERMLRVFGNLPYNISSPLIFHLLDYANIISDMLFMLQKEMAERLAATPGEHNGRLSIMVQYHCETNLLFNVPPSAFYPPPEVQSSIVQLVPYRECPYPVKDHALFAAVVKQAFGQRRKTLRNSLRTLVNDEVWSRTTIRPNLRPEELSVKEFVEISNAVSQSKE